MQRDGLLSSPDDPSAHSSLATVGERSLDGCLTVDTESMEALGIFVREAHPSALMPSSKRKEGLSVLGLLDTCASPQGKRLLRLWMRRPLLDASTLEARLDAVGWLLATVEAAGELASAVKRVRDVQRLLVHLRTPAEFTTLRDWRFLLESLAAVLQLGESLEACGSDAGGAPPAARALFRRLEAAICAPALRRVFELINSVITFEEEEGQASDPSAAVAMVAAGVCECVPIAFVFLSSAYSGGCAESWMSSSTHTFLCRTSSPPWRIRSVPASRRRRLAAWTTTSPSPSPTYPRLATACACRARAVSRR